MRSAEQKQRPICLNPALTVYFSQIVALEKESDELNSESISYERLKRATVVLVGILLVFAILLGRIFWIQTVDFNKYLSKVILATK